MEWAVTITAIVLTAGLTAFSSWKSGRPRKDTPNATWISWPLVTVLAGAALFMVVVHAVNLMGIHTGRGQIGGPPIP
jgi:hypothetical protein